MFLMIKVLLSLSHRKFSCNDTSEATSCKPEHEIHSSISHLINFAQCIVGDSSTVCHGGSYLKKWLAWLEANADVKYAGLE